MRSWMHAVVVMSVACQQGEVDVSAIRQAVGPCSPPLPVADCEQLEQAAGIVHALCPVDPVTLAYIDGGVYANPNDDCDDTAGLRAALARAGTRRTVYLPAGPINPVSPYVSRPYLVSQPIDVSGRRLRGDILFHQGTMVAVMPGVDLSAGNAACSDLPLQAMANNAAACAAGAIFYAVGAGAQLENVTSWMSLPDGGAAWADYLFFASGAPNSRIRVASRFVRASGLHVEASPESDIEGANTLFVRGNGIVVVDSPGSRLFGTVTIANGLNGTVIASRSPDASAMGAPVSLANVDAEVNDAGGVVIQGVRQSVEVARGWLEGNRFDAVRAENAEHVRVVANRILAGRLGPHPAYPTESINHAVSFIDCSDCGTSDNIYSVDADYRVTWFEGRQGTPRSASNYYWGSMNYGPTEYPGGGAGVAARFAFDGGVTVGSQHARTTHSDDKPDASVPWRVGDIVWNSSPDAGALAGWICAATAGTYSHVCTTWLGLPALLAP